MQESAQFLPSPLVRRPAVLEGPGLFQYAKRGVHTSLFPVSCLRIYVLLALPSIAIG
jgi:hypothetical protein